MIALLDPELLEQQYPLLQLPDEQGFELEHDENVQIKPDACWPKTFSLNLIACTYLEIIKHAISTNFNHLFIYNKSRDQSQQIDY